MLEKILNNHKLWLNRQGGTRANLSNVNLTKIDLSHADLRLAILAHTNLSKANLEYTNLAGANLFGADLSHASLYMSNLSEANLSQTNLVCANLTGTRLAHTYGLPEEEIILSRLEKLDGYYVAYVKTLDELITNKPYDKDRRNLHSYGIYAANYDYYADKNNLVKILTKNVCVPYATDGKFRCGNISVLQTMRF